MERTRMNDIGTYLFQEGYLSLCSTGTRSWKEKNTPALLDLCSNNFRDPRLLPKNGKNYNIPPLSN